ncbi:N-acetyltransferase ESCO2-like [Genypterus blacodes]|uniref:N-acetyltransferase ESCO2-like n=1 Tax=Genypterus blacodes TaxID=154954 RepID=UPI003F76C2DC
MPTPRKRMFSSLDSDSDQSRTQVREEMSPAKRRSPRKHLQSSVRKKLAGCLEKENCPSPQKSPRRPAGSPCKSPTKPAMVTSSFYGKQKTTYLTPLERKKIKEALPHPSALPSPPAKQVKKPTRKTVKGGKKLKKVPAKHAAKLSFKGSLTSSTTIKLPKLGASGSAKQTVAASSKPMEPKKGIPIIFSCLKPKPKLFVGAAFFSTGKKPTSMYKKSTLKSTARPAQGKSKAAVPQDKKDKPQQPSAPGTEEPQEVRSDECVYQPPTEENQPSKQRTRFDPSDWMDMGSEPETPQPLSSPEVLGKKYGITKELRVVLTRSPAASTILPFNTLDDSVTDGVSDLSDLSPNSTVSSPPKELAAVYPIFGSASKRLKKNPVSCSTPSGSTQTLQAPFSSAKERSLRRRKEKQGDDQLIIDAGQKQFGAITCGSCGMVYSADNPEDNFQHTQFHQRFLDSIKFVGWKKERVVAEFWDGKILLVLPDDPKYAIKKAEDVRVVADNELGFQQVTLSSPRQAKTYLFINTERMVVGCLVAEHIRQAYRVLEQPNQHKDMTKEDFMERHRAWCSSTVPEQALCGISRIWVFSMARRKGIATRMLDTVRSTFMYGSPLTKEEIAFSDPTPDGKLFATKYCDTPTFLVYNFIA